MTTTSPPESIWSGKDRQFLSQRSTKKTIYPQETVGKCVFAHKIARWAARSLSCYFVRAVYYTDKAAPSLAPLYRLS